MSPPRLRESGYVLNDPTLFVRTEMHNSWAPEEEPGIILSETGDSGYWANGASSAQVMLDTSDGLGKNADGDFVVPRAVDHVKVSFPLDDVVHEEDFVVGQYYGTTKFSTSGTPFFRGDGGYTQPTDFDGACPLPPTQAVSEFSNKCLDEMESQFPPELDILAFLGELKSLPGTIYNLKKISDLLGKRTDLRQTIKQIADIHVNNEFGVEPALADFVSIYNVMHKVRKRLEWLRRNRNKWVRVGSRSRYEQSFDDYLFHFGQTGYLPLVEVRHVHTAWTLNCTARVKQNFPWLDGWEAEVRGLIQMGGINRPLTTWWELTPWSWAVDYWFPVGEYFSRVSFQDITDWVARDICWSSKGEHTFELVAKAYDDLGYRQKVIGNFGYSRYRRNLNWPPWEWYTKTPSLRQLALLAAVGTHDL